MDAAFSQGWRRVKLYFLIGLPTERDEDVIGIADLAPIAWKSAGAIKSPVTVTASVGLRPKAHTPFQWSGQDTNEASSARSTCCASRRPPPRADHPLARPRGFGRRRGHEPRRSTDGAVSSGCGGPGEPSKNGRSASTCGCRRTPWPKEGLSLSRWLPRPRTSMSRWRGTTSPAGLHRDFLWTDWQDTVGQGQGRGLSLDPVLRLRRSTGYGLEPVVASPVPPAVGAKAPARTWRVGAGSRCAWSVPPSPVHLDGRRRAPPDPTLASPSRAGFAYEPATWPACGSGPAAQPA